MHTHKEAERAREMKRERIGRERKVERANQ
jgi:hypothetical protein